MLAVITGASSGIGKGYAYALAKLGYDLVLVARRQKLLEELRSDLQTSFKVKVEFQVLDLGAPEGPEALVKFLASKRVDLFFNNAGAGATGNFIDTPVDKVMGLVFLLMSSLTYLTHQMVKQMSEAGGGRIINVSSGLAFWPYVPGYAMYSATKQYVLGFSRAVDEENKKLNNNVRVITLVPGVIATEFSATRSATGQVSDEPALGMPTDEFVHRTLPKLLNTTRSIVLSGKYIRVIQFANTYYGWAVAMRTAVLGFFLRQAAKARDNVTH